MASLGAVLLLGAVPGMVQPVQAQTTGPQPAQVQPAQVQPLPAPSTQVPSAQDPSTQPAPQLTQPPSTQAQSGQLQTATPVAPAASSADAFTVGGIPVDVTSTDAVSARNQAIVEAQQAGLDRLLQRLVPAEEQARLPRAANLPINDYVQSFQIDSEELSSTRYIGQLTVSYEPDAVRGLLQQSDIPFAQTVSVPMVVLPLYETQAGARLWPEDNPWWEAWALHMDPEELLRLVLPLGDLEDFAKVSVQQAQVGDTLALADLARRYGAEDTLVVTARAIGGPLPENVTSIQLDARRVGQIEQRGQSLNLAVGPARPLDAAMALAVEQIQSNLDEQWKNANLLRFDQGGLMLVDVPIARLSDWIGVKQRLESLPEVSQIVMSSFARDEVALQIRYIGDEFRLEQALARLGLALTREGESWLLLPTGRNPSEGGQRSVTSTAS